MGLIISNLKEIIYQTLGQDLLDADFKFVKAPLFEFKKKFANKSKIRIWFDFYNYKSLWLEFKYVFYFTIGEIMEEANRFQKYRGLEPVEYYIPISEGDFHPSTKDKEAKYRMSGCHRIYDIEKDMHQIEFARKLLKEEFFPLIPRYTELKLFQDYVLKNYNTLPDYIHCTVVLIAAKLKGLTELEKLVSYYWEMLELDKKPDTHSTKQFISKLIPYAKSDNVSN